VRGAATQLGVVTRLVMRAAPVAGARYGCGTRPLITLDGPPPAEAAAAAVSTILSATDAARAMTRQQSCDLTMTRAGNGDLTLAAFPFMLEGSAPFDDAVCEALAFDGAALPPGCYWPIPVIDAVIDEPRGADAPPQESLQASTARHAAISVDCCCATMLCLPCHVSTMLQASGEVFSYVRQIYVDELGPAGAEVLLRAAMTAPSKMSCVILQHGGGVSRDARPGTLRHATLCYATLRYATLCYAYAYAMLGSCWGCRKWEFSVLFMSLWDDASPEARQANEAWGPCARLELCDLLVAYLPPGG
jgi:hypothetical protein